MRAFGTRTTILGALLVSLYAMPANAQATRTWVSGVGDDANPCSRTAPCKTFAGAISKTAAGGEISVLDPGGFGAVTITKAITINGDGTLAGILASLVNGVIINAGVNDRIVLRNISLNGAGNGLNGIRYLAGKQVTVENCEISGFTGNGIDVSLTATGTLHVKDTTITNVAKGIRMATTAGFAVAAMDNVKIYAPTTNGVEVASANAVAAVNNSTVQGAPTAFTTVTSSNGILSVTNSLVANNVTAFNASSSGSIIRVSASNIFDNSNVFTVAGGANIFTGANNKVAPDTASNPTATIQVK
jgi:hypothetical protein